MWSDHKREATSVTLERRLSKSATVDAEDCPAGQIDVDDVNDDIYGVEGCGGYLVPHGVDCHVQSILSGRDNSCGYLEARVHI